MSALLLIAMALGIGVIAGLRSMTAPALVALAAHLKWLDLDHSFLSFLGSPIVVGALLLLALGEIVFDKLPFVPSRKTLGPFLGRIVAGALSGGALCAGLGGSMAVGAVAGALGALGGTLGGYEARTRSVAALGVPDLVIALLEDAVAVVVGLFLVSRGGYRSDLVIGLLRDEVPVGLGRVLGLS